LPLWSNIARAPFLSADPSAIRFSLTDPQRKRLFVPPFAFSFPVCLCPVATQLPHPALPPWAPFREQPHSSFGCLALQSPKSLFWSLADPSLFPCRVPPFGGFLFLFFPCNLSFQPFPPKIGCCLGCLFLSFFQHLVDHLGIFLLLLPP